MKLPSEVSLSLLTKAQVQIHSWYDFANGSQDVLASNLPFVPQILQ